MSSTHRRTRTAAVTLLAITVASALAVVPAAGAAAPVTPDEGALVDDLASGENDTPDLLDDGTGTTVDANASLTVGDETDTSPIAADLDADASAESGGGAVPNTSVGADASVDTDAGELVAVNASVGATAGDDSNASGAGSNESRGAARAGPDGPVSTDGTGGSDGSTADDGSPGLPTPQGAGAGLAVGSLLVGGGLVGRRVVETSVATGGGGGSLLSTTLAWLRAWGWRVLAVAGYQRFDGSDPLEHDTRAAIYAHLQDSPGTYPTELHEATGVPVSTLRYHLRILAFENLVTSVTVRGKRRYVPADVDPDALEPALEDEATAAVLEAVARQPDSVTGLADRLDRDPSTVTHHLQRLDDEGLIEREREGRSVVTRLADGLDATDVVAATAGRAASSAD